MGKIRVYPYKQGSRSAKALAVALDGKVLKHVNSKYRPRAGDTVINWGASVLPVLAPATTLNAPEAVKVAANKLKAFKALHEAGVRVPAFVFGDDDRLKGRTKKEAAAELGFPVVCRQKLSGHSGEGIVIAEIADELVDAPLYTKYVKKKDEYRVHILDGEPFFIQRKARKLDVENPDWKVRNLAGGFAFVEVEQALVPQDVIDQAVEAIEALGLDFGGVDVIWNEKEQKAYVLEINTACGLEERTAGYYRDAFVSYLAR